MVTAQRSVKGLRMASSSITEYTVSIPKLIEAVDELSKEQDLFQSMIPKAHIDFINECGDEYEEWRRYEINKIRLSRIKDILQIHEKHNN